MPKVKFHCNRDILMEISMIYVERTATEIYVHHKIHLHESLEIWRKIGKGNKQNHPKLIKIIV